MTEARKIQISRTMIIIMSALLLAVTIIIPTVLLGGRDASALTGPPGGEWATVAGYLDAYIDAQFAAADDGEAGFLIEAGPHTGGTTTLKDLIDSNNDGTYLGEGDDAANAPVLVDVLSGFMAWLPATSHRVNWNTTAGDASSIAAIKTLVENHEAAGFSTDIITYCATGHTESVVAGAYGAISQAGGFGGSTPPTVLALKWGRYGWDTGGHTYGLTKNVTANLVTPGTNPLPTNSACTGTTPLSELVRCAADDALANVGAGTNVWASGDDANHQPVDLRSSIPGTMSLQTTPDTAYAIQNPLQSLFDSAGSYGNLAKIDASGAQVFFTNRTPHTAGIAAVGATMLGYDATFAKWGLPEWNNTLGEKYVNGQSYGQVVTPVDTTAPILSNVAAAVNPSGGVITWTTNEPATSILEWSTTPGGPYTKQTTGCDSGGTPEPCTILRTSHSMTLTGQSPGTTIYYRVSSYDGQANGGTPTTEGNFTTMRSVDHSTDRVYYLPWYDSSSTGGWLGDWVVIANIGGNAADVEVRINGQIKTADPGLAAGATLAPSYANVTDGMLEVICFDCITNSDSLVVSQRTIFKDTFNEVIAPEWADLGKTWYFPWHDNNAASGMTGDWILIANPDTTSATVDISIAGSAVAESPVTVAAGAVEPVRIAATSVDGPLMVSAQGSQKLVVTQRVIFKNSFNELLGIKTA